METEGQLLKPKYDKAVIPTVYLVIGVILFVISIASAFIGGLYLRQFITINNPPRPVITPTPTSNIPADETEQTNSQFINGKQYFDDTVIAITDSTPPKILVATVTRQEVYSGSNQATRVSYFNGVDWNRKTMSKHYDTTAIYSNDLVSQWNITIDESRVLKQSVRGVIRFDDNLINFDTKTITNNIAVRSLPGYTKFMSTNEGELIINGERYNSKIVYTRIYSNNSKEIQFYDTPFGLTTHWLVFWDNKGNFYHIDSTYVKNPTDIYKTHQLAVVVDGNGAVNKTFQVKVTNDDTTPPNSYNIKLGPPINKTINFNSLRSINKAPNNAYDWYMSYGTGSVVDATGFGLVEYIHQ